VHVYVCVCKQQKDFFFHVLWMLLTILFFTQMLELKEVVQILFINCELNLKKIKANWP
jgi:hypothetical protein